MALLEGVRVLDMGWVLGGPFAGQLLAQMGADVVKIESPEGDLARGIPPHFADGESSFFLSVNRGKRSVAIDLKQSHGRAVFEDLVRRSDAVIHNFAPDVPKRLGVDLQTLKKINSRICVGQLIGFHDEGEYRNTPAFDLVIQAQSGFMSLTGERGGKPVRAGYQVADLAGGLYLALGLVGALLGAARTGEGREIQVSLFDCQIALLTWQAQNYFISGEVPRRNGSRHHMIAPSEVFAGSDGRYFVISPTGDAFFGKFSIAIGHAELAFGPHTVMLCDEFPECGIRSARSLGATPVTLHLHVDDADAMLAQAVAAGATLEREASDAFYGERSGVVRCPFGHRWLIGHAIEQVTPEEMQRRYTALFN